MENKELPKTQSVLSLLNLWTEILQYNYDKTKQRNTARDGTAPAYSVLLAEALNLVVSVRCHWVLS